MNDSSNQVKSYGWRAVSAALVMLVVISLLSVHVRESNEDSRNLLIQSKSIPGNGAVVAREFYAEACGKVSLDQISEGQFTIQ